MPKPATEKAIVTWDRDGNIRIDKNHPVFRSLVEQGSLPEDYIEKCLYSEDGLMYFCRYFLAESFKKPFTPARREFARNFSNPDLARVWGMASRGFGKSALIVAEMIRGCCFRLYPFIVYSSSELGLAEARTNAVKSALLSNHRIRLFFGNMTPQFVDGRREAFGTESYTLSDPDTNIPFCVVVPKSEGTTVNGLLESINGVFVRPSFLVSDDGEDRSRVDSEEYRQQHQDWLFDTFFNCVDTDHEPDHNRWKRQRGERAPWLLRVFDTCKHEGAALEAIAADPSWTGARYPAAEEVEPGVFRSLNPAVTDEQVQAKYESAKKRPTGAGGFYREFMCVAREAAESTFPSTFRYYHEHDLKLNEDPHVHRIIIVDPARTPDSSSAYTAMLAVAVDAAKNTIYLRRLVNDHLSIDTIADTLFRLAAEMNTYILCVEDAGLNDWIKGPLMRGAELRNMFPLWMWLPPGGNNIATSGSFGTGKAAIKRRRAASAIGFYKPFLPTHPDGSVWHEDSLRNSALEQQMHSYPNPARWDALDTLAYLDYVLRQLGIVFDFQIEDGEELQEMTSRGKRIDDAHRYGAWRVAC